MSLEPSLLGIIPDQNSELQAESWQFDLPYRLESEGRVLANCRPTQFSRHEIFTRVVDLYSPPVLLG